MKRSGLRVVLAFGVLLLTSLTASAQVLPSFSRWENQRTSTLDVGLVTGNQFSGWFTNHAQGFQCQGTPYPATGTILPNGAITFTVNFTACNSVTVWKGRVIGSQMPTKWILYYNGIQKLTGADTFRRLQLF